MFGIGMAEFLALAVLALIVLGPEKLPKFAADVARILRQLREMANNAKEDVRRELGPEFQDISLDDLNARNLVRRHLLDDIDLESEPRGGNQRTPGIKRRPHEDPPLPDGSAPPYDPDAT